MNKKFLVIISIVVIIIAIFSWRSFVDQETDSLQFAEVTRGSIAQKVVETGVVKAGGDIDLSFQKVEEIKDILINEGSQVERGQVLAELDNAQLITQLEKARASLDMAQAELDKLLAGAKPEKIEVAETKVTKAQKTLQNAQQHLQDIKNIAQNDLEVAYQDAVSTLESAYLTLSQAFATVREIQDEYFIDTNLESYQVRNEEDEIEIIKEDVKYYRDLVQENYSHNNVDTALSAVQEDVQAVMNSLEIVDEMCYEPAYRHVVSASDKSALDTEQSNVNTTLTNLINAQQNIQSTRLSNQSNINQARTAVEEASNTLQQAQKDLTLLTSDPQPEDVSLYKAKVKQAQAQVDLLQQDLAHTRLRAPVAGQVTQLNKEVGESVQLSESVVTLIPNNKLQIKVDVYEEDIPQIDVGDPVKISVVALPEQTFSGQVTNINPAGQVQQGVVYYEVTISFEQTTEKVKPEMTADVEIQTLTKKDVLLIPEDAVQEEDGDSVVEVSQDGHIKQRKVETGLEQNDQVEILSGLQVGEKIIVK